MQRQRSKCNYGDLFVLAGEKVAAIPNVLAGLLWDQQGDPRITGQGGPPGADASAKRDCEASKLRF